MQENDKQEKYAVIKIAFIVLKTLRGQRANCPRATRSREHDKLINSVLRMEEIKHKKIILEISKG